MRKLLRPAVAAAVLLLAGGLAAHQAGWSPFFRVRHAITGVQAERGLAFVSPAGPDWSDDALVVAPRLFEDGRPLGPAPSPRREIRKLGGGRYGLWDGALYFSSSDGTDPRTSGRRYTLERPWPLSRRTAGLAYLLFGAVVAWALRPRSSLANGTPRNDGEGDLSSDGVVAAEGAVAIAPGVQDAIAILLFAAAAVGLFLIHGNGEYPFVWLGSDASQLASFAAAEDHPEAFGNDTLLGDPANYRFYATLHVPLLRWLTRFSGDYGTSFLWLLGPTVFLQLLGFYGLGRVLFGGRIWALLLALLSSGTTLGFGPGEFWGLWADSLPRNVFQAILPFVLLAVLRWRSVPASWPLIMAGLGALMYLHPVSAPAWGAAVWLGLASEGRPSGWKISRLLLSGVVFALVAGTFLWAFNRHQRPSSPEVAEQALRLQDRVYGFESGSQPVSLPVLLELASEHRLLFAGGLVAMVIVWRVPPRNRSAWRLTLLWLVGILLVSLGLPLLIQLLAGNPHTTSTQRVLIRNLRFLFPLVFVQCVWALAVLDAAARKPATRLAIVACGVLLAGVWLSANPPMLWPQERARWSGWGRSRDPDTLAILQAIKEETPLTARLLSFEDGRFEASAIRYFSFRSLAYCYKDFGPLGHTNDLALLRWGDAQAKYEDLRSRPRDASQLEAFAAFARELEADHLLVHAPPAGSLPRGVVLVNANASYALFRLEARSPGE